MNPMTKWCLVLIMFSAGLFAQTRTDPENKLIAMENAWNAAQRDHDAKAMDLMISDQFINTDWDGSVQNRAEFLRSIKDTSMKIASLTNDGVSVFFYGNTAIVAGAYHLKGTNKGKPYEAHGRFTDTWVQMDGRWKCVASSSQHTKG
jgi:ketosteroid isomerase-like protein